MTIRTVPKGILPVRYEAPKQIEVADLNNPPMLDPKNGKNVQERIIAHVEIFNLSIKEEKEAYERSFQKICDGAGVLGDNKVEWNSDAKSWIALLRWGEYQYLPPSA